MEDHVHINFFAPKSKENKCLYIYDKGPCSYIKLFQDSMASDKRTDSRNAKLMLLICLINSLT